MPPKTSRWLQRPSLDRAARERIVDETMERYVDWREASTDVTEAYGNWSSAPAADGAMSFAAYRAALDREESAATLYSAVLDRATSLFGAELTGARPGVARR